MRIVYKCDLCGKEFDHLDECSRHESNHVRPIAIHTIGDYSDEETCHPYPIFLTVRMSDSALVRYGFGWIVERPKPQLSE